jgi:hypothetical protein
MRKTFPTTNVLNIPEENRVNALCELNLEGPTRLSHIGQSFKIPACKGEGRRGGGERGGEEGICGLRQQEFPPAVSLYLQE